MYSTTLTTATTGATLTGTWKTWITSAPTATGTIVLYEERVVARRPPTPEEDQANRELLEAQREQWRRAQDEEKRLRLERYDRAQALLRRVLTDGQWSDYQADGKFAIIGSDGRRYDIENHSMGNIIAHEGETRTRYCAHPRNYDHKVKARLPVPDILAAQALALRTDARSFLAVANIHGVWNVNDSNEDND